VYKLLAAQDRLDQEHRVAFSDAVESVRIGTVIASNARAARTWRLEQKRAASREVRGETGLSGAALEQAVMAIAGRSPEYVVIRESA
jgi:hypothetical protein